MYLSPDEAARKYCRDVFVPNKFQTATHAAKTTIGGVLHAVVTRVDKLWPADGNAIKYSFVEGSNVGTKIQQNKVTDTIKEWTYYANVKFELVQSGGHVRIAFDPSPAEGSWSLVGTDCLTAPAEKATMNLGWINDTDVNATPGEAAVILHEFGHVLGLLHEHQSPGGGGIPISRRNAAVKFYGEANGWDEKTVQEQVIDTYNLRDVSSFSQVDRTSIMHYPMPAWLTGLDHDIDYNYSLSDQDKAYMCLMYPWTYDANLTANTNSATGPRMRFHDAMHISGINNVLENAGEMLKAFHQAQDMNQAQVNNIRDIFSNWCRSEHAKRALVIIPNKEPEKDDTKEADLVSDEPKKDDVKEADPHDNIPKKDETEETDPVNDTPKKDDTKKTDPIKDEPKNEDAKKSHSINDEQKKKDNERTDSSNNKSENNDTGRVQFIDNPTIEAEPLVMCSTNTKYVTESKESASTNTKIHEMAPQHAVIDPNWLSRVQISEAANKVSDYELKIRYVVLDCPNIRYPTSTTAQTYTKATSYQLSLLNQAFRRWEMFASIRFEEAKDGNDADLKIVFQNLSYSDHSSIEKTSDELRSYTLPPSAVGERFKQLITKDDPPEEHTICYRAISKDHVEAEAKASDKLVNEAGVPYKITNLMWDIRTLLHELGHYLGLVHEEDGAYGFLIFNDEIDLKSEFQETFDNARAEFVLTKFDYGSVMDRLRIPENLSALFKQANRSPNDVRMKVRTRCDLSEYDKANIAFLHPGKRLSGIPGARKIRVYCRDLRLTENTKVRLQELADEMNWKSFRSEYLSALAQQTKTWEDSKNNVIKELQKDARKADNALHGLKDPLHDTLKDLGKDKPNAEKSLLRMLYAKLTETIGPTGDQLLTLQSPTRYLAKEEFQYELAGIYSNFIKPVPVAEAEFRLTDALYDATEIVSGPNGRNLSTVYNQVINNLVPIYTDKDRKVRKERERIRSWLLTEVGQQDPYYKLEFGTAGGGHGDNPEDLEELNKHVMENKNVVRKMSRMEFASQLTQDYYDAQMQWELARDKLIEDAIDMKDPKKLATATRKLVHITQSQQGKLSMKYANSVVRGYSHIVREALGHLDVATPAELLQDAKDSFRMSAVSSLYGASRIYPVLMSPVDWSAALDTGFTPEDLSENPEMITMMIKTKTGAMDNLKRQLATLQASMDGDPVKMRAEVEDMAKKLEDAEAKLHRKYTDSAIGLAKIIAAIATDGGSLAAEGTIKDVGVLAEMEAVKAENTAAYAELDKAAKELDPLGAATDAITQVALVHQAQTNLQAATSAWNSRKAALARAEATSTKTEQAFLESQIRTLDSEIVGLDARLAVAYKARAHVKALAKDLKEPRSLQVADLATKKPLAVAGGSRWQEINITHDQKYSEQSTSTEARATTERWNTDFWIGSAGGSKETSESSFLAKSGSREIHMEISMKVTLVTTDRSSWFQPQLFDNSKAYMKNNENFSFNAPQTVSSKGRPVASVLPSFPVGYILCKDVFIRCSNMDTASEAQRYHLLEKAQASGGCLCFSYNQASEHSKDSSSASFQMASDGMIIRIPGPQILAYVQQIVPQDESEMYDAAKSLVNEFYLPEPASAKMAENNDKTDGHDTTAAHGMAPPDGYSSGGAKPKRKINFTMRASSLTLEEDSDKLPPSSTPVKGQTDKPVPGIGTTTSAPTGSTSKDTTSAASK